MAITVTWKIHLSMHNRTYCKNYKEGNEKNNYILDPLSTIYSQQAFKSALNMSILWLGFP